MKAKITSAIKLPRKKEILKILSHNGIKYYLSNDEVVVVLEEFDRSVMRILKKIDELIE